MRVALINNHVVQLIAEVDPEALDAMTESWRAIYDTVAPLQDTDSVNPGDVYVYVPSV